MTDETRTAVLVAMWGAVRTLVPTNKLPDAARLTAALECLYDDYSDERFHTGFSLGLRKGAMLVEAREDRRDLCDVQDPPELRSVH